MAALLVNNDWQVLEAMEIMAQHHRFNGRQETALSGNGGVNP
jgi:hypothetical protein